MNFRKTYLMQNIEVGIIRDKDFCLATNSAIYKHIICSFKSAVQTL